MKGQAKDSTPLRGCAVAPAILPCMTIAGQVVPIQIRTVNRYRHVTFLSRVSWCDDRHCMHPGMEVNSRIVTAPPSVRPLQHVHVQDWSYIDRHTMELTLEVSQNKAPPADSLADLFAANLPALLALPAAAGLEGLRCDPKASGSLPCILGLCDCAGLCNSTVLRQFVSWQLRCKRAGAHGHARMPLLPRIPA